MSPREGTRENQGSMCHGAPLLGHAWEREADGPTPSGHIASPPLFSRLLSTVQDHFLFVAIVLGDQSQSLLTRSSVVPVRLRLLFHCNRLSCRVFLFGLITCVLEVVL